MTVTAVVADPDGLEAFDEVRGRLEIELTEATVNITAKLANQTATPTAEIKNLKFETYIIPEDPDADFRPLTPHELDRVVFRGAVLVLQGRGEPVTHVATSGVYTVRDLLRAIEDTELKTRSQSEWFEGIDVHHVYFEGIALGDDGVWSIHWGS